MLVAFPPDYGLNGGHEEEEEEEVKAGSPSCSPSEGRRGLSNPLPTQISDPELQNLRRDSATFTFITLSNELVAEALRCSGVKKL